MRVFVVEDEAVIGRRLIRLLRDILGEGLESIEWAASLDEALTHVQSHSIDVLFLDLNLRGEDGFALLHEAVAGSFQTIVVSAQHDQALRAFEYGVVDFVAKPYDEARLRLAIERATERDESLRHQLKFLAVKKVGEIVPVPIETVVYVKGAGDYSELHTDDGSRHLHAKTLSHLENLLPPDFERVHRSYLADMRRVIKLRTLTGGQHVLELSDGSEIPVSRIRFKQLMDRLG